MIPSTSLAELAQEQLALALKASSKRASATVHGGHTHALRQTVIALAAGAQLSEHENPGEATVQVLIGRVTVSGADDRAEAGPGDLVVVPEGLHSLHATEDAVVVLTAVPRGFLR